MSKTKHCAYDVREKGGCNVPIKQRTTADRNVISAFLLALVNLPLRERQHWHNLLIFCSDDLREKAYLFWFTLFWKWGAHTHRQHAQAQLNSIWSVAPSSTNVHNLVLAHWCSSEHYRDAAIWENRQIYDWSGYSLMSTNVQIAQWCP